MACETNMLHVGISFYALCVHNAHITVYDVTMHMVNLVNPSVKPLTCAFHTAHSCNQLVSTAVILSGSEANGPLANSRVLKMYS